MNNEKKYIERLKYISIAQIISMLFIMLGHSVPNSQKVPEIIIMTAYYLTYIALPTFMWASGYLFIRTSALKKYGYWKLLKKRCVRLIIPYICVSFLMLFPKYLLSMYSAMDTEISAIPFLKALVYPRNGILPHLWFLSTLMIMAILSPIIELSIRNRIIGLLSLAGSASLIFIPAITGFIGLNDVKLYLFWYILGAYNAKYLKLEILFKNCKILLLACGVYISIAVFAPITSITGFITSLVAIFCLLGIAHYLEHSKSRVWDLLEYKTLSIYILSLPIQNIVEILSIRIGLPIFATIICMFTLGLTVSFFIIELAKLIEKKMKYKVLSRIIGMSL